jgi:glycosyltransferase involved in cell wall biosynthesis
MRFGIDASRAFIKEKTGINKYALELISYLSQKNNQLLEHQFFLFIKSNQLNKFHKNFFKRLPFNWKVISVPALPFLWTQVGLCYSAYKKNLDYLIIPSHAVPLFYNRKTVYVLHGLEMFERPDCYSLVNRIFNKFFIKRSLKKANKVVSVSRTSKINAGKYFGSKISEKIKVIYQVIDFKVNVDYLKINKDKIIQKTESKGNIGSNDEFKKFSLEISKKFQKNFKKPYLIYVGTLEKRKNILNLIKAFEIAKKNKRNLKLVLIGLGGYKYNLIKNKINKSKYAKDIFELGYVSDKEKYVLIQNAVCLLQLSFAEGFGRTVAEALLLNTAVLISNIHVFKEFYQHKDYKAGLVFFVNHKKPIFVAKKIIKIINKNSLNSYNVKNFTRKNELNLISLRKFKQKMKSKLSYENNIRVFIDFLNSL